MNAFIAYKYFYNGSVLKCDWNDQSPYLIDLKSVFSLIDDGLLNFYRGCYHPSIAIFIA